MPRATHPDIVLVVFDTARADAVTPYGASAEQTPVLACLVRDGGAALPAVSTANWTLPAHASMFTGLLPRQIGLAQAPGGTPQGARPAMAAVAHRSLPVVLRSAGYQTFGVTANGWVSGYSGFDAGFDEFHYVTGGRDERIVAPGLRGAARFAWEAALARVDDGIGEAERVILDLLARADPRRPLFLFVNLVECHSPYLPPRPYNDLGWWARGRAGLEARRYLTLEGIWRACTGSRPVPAPALVRMRRLYDRSIRSMDDWLGRFLEAMDHHRSVSDAVVAVTSDHGENFGEDNLIGHAFSLDDRLLRVPLVVSAPVAGDPGPTVSLAQLPALLSGLAGLSTAPWAADELPCGVAIAQQDGLAASDDPRVADVGRRWRLSEDARRLMTWSLTVARDDRVKLVRRPDGDVVYDLVADPMEANPCASADVPVQLRERVARLTQALEHPASTSVTRWSAPDEQPAADDEEARRLEESMRLLGYL